jgi:hypothetical protein
MPLALPAVRSTVPETLAELTLVIPKVTMSPGWRLLTLNVSVEVPVDDRLIAFGPELALPAEQFRL